MKKLAMIAAAALGVAALPTVAAAQDATGTYNGHTYYWYNTGTTWSGALAAAAASGSGRYLATVTSQGENDFIRSLTNQNTVFIAGTDADVEGVWKWAAGPEIGQIFYGPGAIAGAYSNWNSGEPNDANGGEDYLHMNFGAGWNDIYGSYTNGYVVEFGGLANVPEPATWALMIMGFGAVGGALRRRPRAALATA